MKRITIILDVEDEDFEEFMEQEEVNNDLNEFIFTELCSNWGLGFLRDVKIEEVDE